MLVMVGIVALGAASDPGASLASPASWVVTHTLAAMAELWGARQAVVALELTKRFERVHRGTLADLAAEFADTETKGEAVIVVAGAAEAAAPEAADWQAALATEMEGQSLRVAVDDVTKRFGLKRKEVYDAALAIKAEK